MFFCLDFTGKKCFYAKNSQYFSLFQKETYFYPCVILKHTVFSYAIKRFFILKNFTLKYFIAAICVFLIVLGWVLLIATLLFFRREINRKELSIIVALFVFSLILALLIGWTTPVLGAIIRYKVPIQLAMMVVTLIVFNPKRLKNE